MVLDPTTLFDRLAALPANAWNWDDRGSGLPLREGKARVPGAVIGRLDQWTTLKTGTAEEATAQARDAITQTDGLGLILGAGCVLPPEHGDATLIELIRWLGGQVQLGLIPPR